MDAQKLNTGILAQRAQQLQSITTTTKKTLPSKELMMMASAISPSVTNSRSSERTIATTVDGGGELIATLRDHRYPVLSVSYNNDGSKLVSLALSDYPLRHYEVKVWNISDGDGGAVTKSSLTLHFPLSEPGSPGFCPRFHPIFDDSVILVTEDRKIGLWDTSSNTVETKTFRDQTTIGWDQKLLFDPSGTLLAVTSPNNITVWNILSGLKIHQLNTPSSALSITFHPASKQLAATFFGQHSIFLWNLQTGTIQHKLKSDSTQVFFSVSYSPDGRSLASTGTDGTVRIWNLQQGTSRTWWGSQQQRAPRCNLILQGHAKTVYCVAWSPDSSYVVSGSSDQTIRIWDAKLGGLPLRVFHDHSTLFDALDWSTDGIHIASVSQNSSIQILEINGLDNDRQRRRCHQRQIRTRNHLLFSFILGIMISFVLLFMIGQR